MENNTQQDKQQARRLVRRIVFFAVVGAVAWLASALLQGGHDAVLEKKAPEKAAAPAAAVAKGPNIILFYAGHIGIGDVGKLGGITKTPNLDRMLETGLYLSSFSHRTTKGDDDMSFLLTGGNPKDANASIATKLKHLGYRTGMTGPWQIPASPSEWGFAHCSVNYAEGCGSFRGVGWNDADDKEFFKPLHAEMAKELTKLVEVENNFHNELVTLEAISFMQEETGAPYFLLVSYYAPRAPYGAAPRYLMAYPDLLPEEASKRMEALYPDAGERTQAWKVARQRLAEISQLDEGVGAVLREVFRQKKQNDTVAVFLGRAPSDTALGNAPLSMPLAEGNFRTVALMYGPGRIQPEQWEEPTGAADMYNALLYLGGSTEVQGTGLSGKLGRH